MEEIKVNRPVKDINNVTSTTGQYNKVVVKQLEKDSIEEIHPEVLYLTIPSEWTCVYHQLINYVADAGKSIIDDCSFACKGDGKKLFNCWGLFQSACAPYQQSDYTKAEFYYNYVNQQLEVYYHNFGKPIYNGTNYYPITPDGKLKALCSCSGNNFKFTVDIDTGKLYQDYLYNKDNDEVFTIDNNGDLNVESENKV